MDEDDDPRTIEARHQTEDRSRRLRHEPAVMLKYGGQAGHVLAKPDQNVHSDWHDNLAYQSELGETSQNNPWHPFTSQ